MKYAILKYCGETFIISFKTRLSRALSGKESISPVKAKRQIKSGAKVITA